MTLNELKTKRKNLIREFNKADRQAKKLSQAFTVALNKPDITGAAFREIETASKNAFKVKAKIDGELLTIENEISRIKSKKNPSKFADIPEKWQARKNANSGYNWQFLEESAGTVYKRDFYDVLQFNDYLIGTFGARFAKKVIDAANKHAGQWTGPAASKKNPMIIKAKKISHIDISKTHNPAKLSAADLAKIEKARGLVEALGYKRPVDIRAAWQDTLFTAGMRGRKLLAAVQIATKKRGKNPLNDGPFGVFVHKPDGKYLSTEVVKIYKSKSAAEKFARKFGLNKNYVVRPMGYCRDLPYSSNPKKTTAPELAKHEKFEKAWVQYIAALTAMDKAEAAQRPGGRVSPAWKAARMRKAKALEALRRIDSNFVNNLIRRQNAEHKDADHPINVTEHWRTGPPGYMSPWQRAAALGQSELFSTGIQLSKRAQELRGRRSNPGVTKAAYRSGLKEAPASQLVKLARIGFRTGNTAAAITADLKKTGRFTTAQISRAVGQGRKAEQKAKQNPARGSRRMGGSRELAKSEKSFRQVSRRAVKARESGNDAEYSALLKPLHQRHKTFSDASNRYIERKKQTRKANGAASAVKQIFEKFGGRASTKTKTVSMPNGTPAHVAKLGTLRLIKLKNGPRYEFKGAAAPFLAADHRGKLHVVGGRYRANPPGQTLGEIETIEYETTKPHLGQDDETIYFHHLGEETGERPVMRIDSDGLIKIVGGAYTIEADGIHN